MLSGLLSSHILILYIYRAFTDLLKKDRGLYGADEDYVITDVVADDWQQRVDNVVGGFENDDE